MTFYYDVATGNVAFDTSALATGQIMSYVLNLAKPYEGSPPPPFEFIPKNHITLTNTTLVDSYHSTIGEVTFSTPMRGLYTIGNILPPGISEDLWTTYFDQSVLDYNTPLRRDFGYHSILELTGLGQYEAVLNVNFVYGRPAGEFVSRVDLLDPDSLQWAEAATLRYHAGTGELIVDTSGPSSGYIISIFLQSTHGFLAENFAPDFNPGPVNVADSGTFYSVVDLLDPGMHSLGRVLPVGWTSSQFEASFSRAEFISRAGFGSNNFDYAVDGIDFQFVYVPVPEPSAAVLTFVAGCAWLRRRACMT